MTCKEPDNLAAGLHARHVPGEVEPIDTVNVECDMPIKNVRQCLSTNHVDHLL